MKYLLSALMLVLLPTIASAQIVTPGGGGIVTGGTVTGGSCTGSQFVNAISTTGVPTCATPSTGGVPAGSPPQLVGYSAANTGEAETFGGDATLTRSGANAYSISVTKTAGVAFTGLATAAIPLSIANGGRGSTAAPTTGQIDVASSATAFTPVTMSGDATITSAGVITVTKTNGTSFTALATAAVPLSIANGGRGVSTAPTAGQIDVAQSATTFGAVTMSGDATITSAGAITVTKTSGTAFTGLATAAIPLSIANGGRGSTTAPSIGQIDVASSTTAFTPVTMSGDATITSAGVITVTKTNGTAFTALATATVPLSIANGGNGASTAPTTGQFEVAQSASAYGPVTMSGDATITSAGAITVTKTSGTAFTALATAATPLSIANGGRGSGTAPVAGQIDVASSTTAFTPVTMTGDCGITSGGVITCNKTNGTAFGTLATQSTSAVGFNFAGTVVASTIAAFTCPFNLTIPANFLTPNSVATCVTNPSESDAYTVKVNGVSVGTITLSTSCVATLGSASQTTCSAGQRMEVDAPATVSGANVAITVAVNR